MTLINQYIEEVIECLPVSSRAAAAEKLRLRIDGMLPADATEDDLKFVLEQLGDPRYLAEEYREEKRYLIGPELYSRYIFVLKFVMIFVPALSAMSALIGSIVNKSHEDLIGFLVEIFTDVLSSAVEGAVQAFIWVTVAFVVIERTGATENVLAWRPKKWTVHSLRSTGKKLPNTGKIHRSEPVFGIFFAVLFTAIIYFKPEIIGWYTFVNDHLILKESLFVLERLDFYIHSIIGLALIQIGIFIYKFIRGHWTFPMAIINAGYNLAISVLYANMAVDKDLFNKGFISKFNDLTNTSGATWTKFTFVVAACFIIGCTIDTITGFVKSRRKV